MKILRGSGVLCILLSVGSGREVLLLYRYEKLRDHLEQEPVRKFLADRGYEGTDVVSVIIKLRERYDFPVIFLSAKSEEVDKIMGLNMGADDYITKPFTPMELLARVNSQLRRYRRFLDLLEQRTKAGPEKEEHVYRIRGLELN